MKNKNTRKTILKRNLTRNIFLKSLNKNSRIAPFNTRVAEVGKTKYLPSYSKEWSNTIYAYNKNTMKNLPSNYANINKIIQSYFNLYFKTSKFVGSKFITLKRRRNLLKRIYVSNAEIKHTNNKAIITLFTLNKEKKVLYNKFGMINQGLINFYANLYKACYSTNLKKIHEILSAKDSLLFVPEKISKRSYVNSKFQYLQKFFTLKNLLMQRIWIGMISKLWATQLRILRKYQLLYSLNENKFNNNVLLPKLSNLLTKLLGKKVEYNIINLKSMTYNTDIFTQFLSTKLKKSKRSKPASILDVFLNKIYIPIVKEQKVMESTSDSFINKYKDLKVTSNIENTNLATLIDENNTSNDVHSSIFNSIKYKNTRGLRLELKGRLTKRSRADRSLQVIRFKGGLKNVDSSFKGLSTVLYRGNVKSNSTYSIVSSKRNLGAFAVKGWLGTK